MAGTTTTATLRLAKLPGSTQSNRLHSKVPITSVPAVTMPFIRRRVFNLLAVRVCRGYGGEYMPLSCAIGIYDVGENNHAHSRIRACWPQPIARQAERHEGKEHNNDE